jgi:hypothetical protein
MIAGLPWTAWLLFVLSVGLGLGVELRFLLVQRTRRRTARRVAEDA